MAKLNGRDAFEFGCIVIEAAEGSGLGVSVSIVDNDGTELFFAQTERANYGSGIAAQCKARISALRHRATLGDANEDMLEEIESAKESKAGVLVKWLGTGEVLGAIGVSGAILSEDYDGLAKAAVDKRNAEASSTEPGKFLLEV